MSARFDLQKHLNKPEGLAGFVEIARTRFRNTGAVCGDDQKLVAALAVGLFFGKRKGKRCIARGVKLGSFTAFDDRVQKLRALDVIGHFEGKDLLCLLSLFDNAVKAALENPIVMHRHMSDSVVKIVAGGEHIVLDRGVGFF